MTRLWIGILFCLLALSGVAQQDPMFSQYMFNPLHTNPAYAGSRQAVSTTILHRSQWVGFKGAPTTQTLGIHAPLKKKRIALGGTIINDRIGPVNTFGVFGIYAYKLPLGNGKLSFGLKGGFFNFAYDATQIDYQDSADPLAQQGIVSKLAPSFDFGMYYYTKTWYAGANFSHLAKETFRIDLPELKSESVLRRHLTLTAGKAFKLNAKWVARPSLYLRTLGVEILNADINFSVLYNKKFWMGASLRSTRDLVFLLEYNISRQFRLGYSYDLLLSTVRNHSGGSHEIFLGFDIDLLRNKFYSPRYF